MANDSKDVGRRVRKRQVRGAGAGALAVVGPRSGGALIPLIWLFLGRSDDATGEGPGSADGRCPECSPQHSPARQRQPGAAPGRGPSARRVAEEARPPRHLSRKNRLANSASPLSRQAREMHAKRAIARKPPGRAWGCRREREEGDEGKTHRAWPTPSPWPTPWHGANRSRNRGGRCSARRPGAAPAAFRAAGASACCPCPAACRQPDGSRAVATKTAPSKPALPKPAPSGRVAWPKPTMGWRRARRQIQLSPCAAKRPSAAGSDAGEGIGLGTPAP